MGTLGYLLGKKCIIVPQLSVWECFRYYELPAFLLISGIIGASLLIRYFKFKKLSVGNPTNALEKGK